MIRTELLELIANGENSGVEFKRDDVRPEQLAKEVVALANLQGRRILLGVKRYQGLRISSLVAHCCLEQQKDLDKDRQGVMEPTAAAIEKIVRAIVEEVRPIRVILFGSIARGESRASSDVDLLVVVPEGSHRRQTARRLYKAVSGGGVPFDLVIATEGDIDRYGDRIGLVYRTALAEGRVLYAA